MDFYKRYGWIKEGTIIGSYKVLSLEGVKTASDKLKVEVIHNGRIKYKTAYEILQYPTLKEHNSNWGKQLGPVKLNEWEIKGDYVIGKCTNNNLIFYLDYEDYLKVKDIPLSAHIPWGGRPYVAYRHHIDHKQQNDALLSILGLPYWTRFKNGNHMDFRKQNIDTTTKDRCNIMNRVVGVNYNKEKKSWVAKMLIGDKREVICISKDLGECIRKRFEAELKYYDHSRFQQYKVDIIKELGLEI